MPLSVVILAAGQGKRMNSDLPKVLQTVAGRPLLRFVIEAARALEPQAILVIHGHGGDQVQAAFKAEPVEWVRQAEQLGTGHALLQAMPLIPDDHQVLVLYGDVPLIQKSTLHRLLAAGRESLAVLSVILEEPSGYGRILRDAAGRVTAIIEQRDADRDQLKIREANTGVIAAPAAGLRAWLSRLNRGNTQREYLLTDVVAIAVQSGAPAVAVPAASAAEVQGVNDKIQLAAIEAHYRGTRARELMQAGATLSDPNRTDIRGEVSIGRDVCIDINCVFLGEVELGDRVSIGPNCVIADSVIGADTQIKANCVIEDAIVGADCRIGPFARLRPETRLQEDVHIGNFVEVKKSQIGAHSKANHLTYLGDATVGENVNIGAGSITCNYDGAAKWPTVIEDDVFVGSGSMLIAPLRIGAGATIGAGSSISVAAPAGKLTLARSRQATIDGWVRPRKKPAHTPKPARARKPRDR